jgi:hypothetical protein
MKNIIWSAAIWGALSCQTFAGVVIEMVSKDPNSNQETSADKIYTEGTMVRIESDQQGTIDRITTIFRDETLFIVNHQDQTYHRMDKDSMTRMGSQMSEARKQMEAELAKLPPEQRAMMERMMKGRMPEGMPGAMSSDRPQRRIEVGGDEQVGEYSCTMYTVYRGTDKTQEVCAVPVSQVAVAEEAMEAFQAMARFSKQFAESVQQSPLAAPLDNPFQFLDEIHGLPVLVREFDGGRASSEVFLKSATRQSLSNELFSVPDGYKEVDPFAQMGGRR